MSGLVTVPERGASTADVAPHERLAYWDEYNASELIGLRCSSYTMGGLDARARNFDLGMLRLTEIAGNEHVIERTPALLHRYPRNSVFVAVVAEGEIFFYQSGRCLTARAGDVLVYPTTIPYLCGFAGQARQFIVDLPVASLPDDRRWPIPTGPTRIDGGMRTGQILGGELGRAVQTFADRPLASEAPWIAERMRDLCHALITLPHDLSRTGASAAVRRLHAEAFIAEHLGDERLDAAAVARHLRLSPRHLNRLFAQDGRTVTQWIWDQRLALAHRLLADPVWRHQSVADIAHRCGFTAAAHFTSAFKTRYRLTPSQYRLQAGERLPRQ